MVDDKTSFPFDVLSIKDESNGRFKRITFSIPKERFGDFDTSDKLRASFGHLFPSEKGFLKNPHLIEDNSMIGYTRPGDTGNYVVFSPHKNELALVTPSAYFPEVLQYLGLKQTGAQPSSEVKTLLFVSDGSFKGEVLSKKLEELKFTFKLRLYNFDHKKGGRNDGYTSEDGQTIRLFSFHDGSTEVTGPVAILSQLSGLELPGVSEVRELTPEQAAQETASVRLDLKVILRNRNIGPIFQSSTFDSLGQYMGHNDKDFVFDNAGVTTTFHSEGGTVYTVTGPRGTIYLLQRHFTVVPETADAKAAADSVNQTGTSDPLAVSCVRVHPTNKEDPRVILTFRKGPVTSEMIGALQTTFFSGFSQVGEAESLAGQSQRYTFTLDSGSIRVISTSGLSVSIEGSQPVLQGIFSHYQSRSEAEGIRIEGAFPVVIQPPVEIGHDQPAHVESPAQQLTEKVPLPGIESALMLPDSRGYRLKLRFEDGTKFSPKDLIGEALRQHFFSDYRQDDHHFEAGPGWSDIVLSYVSSGKPGICVRVREGTSELNVLGPREVLGPIATHRETATGFQIHGLSASSTANEKEFAARMFVDSLKSFTFVPQARVLEDYPHLTVPKDGYIGILRKDHSEAFVIVDPNEEFNVRVCASNTILRSLDQKLSADLVLTTVFDLGSYFSENDARQMEHVLPGYELDKGSFPQGRVSLGDAVTYCFYKEMERGYRLDRPSKITIETLRQNKVQITGPVGDIFLVGRKLLQMQESTPSSARATARPREPLTDRVAVPVAQRGAGLAVVQVPKGKEVPGTVPPATKQALFAGLQLKVVSVLSDGRHRLLLKVPAGKRELIDQLLTDAGLNELFGTLFKDGFTKLPSTESGLDYHDQQGVLNHISQYYADDCGFLVLGSPQFAHRFLDLVGLKTTSSGLFGYPTEELRMGYTIGEIRALSGFALKAIETAGGRQRITLLVSRKDDLSFSLCTDEGLHAFFRRLFTEEQGFERVSATNGVTYSDSEGRTYGFASFSTFGLTDELIALVPAAFTPKLSEFLQIDESGRSKAVQPAALLDAQLGAKIEGRYLNLGDLDDIYNGKRIVDSVQELYFPGAEDPKVAGSHGVVHEYLICLPNQARVSVIWNRGGSIQIEGPRSAMASLPKAEVIDAAVRERISVSEDRGAESREFRKTFALPSRIPGSPLYYRKMVGEALQRQFPGFDHLDIVNILPPTPSEPMVVKLIGPENQQIRVSIGQSGVEVTGKVPAIASIDSARVLDDLDKLLLTRVDVTFSFNSRNFDFSRRHELEQEVAHTVKEVCFPDSFDPRPLGTNGVCDIWTLRNSTGQEVNILFDAHPSSPSEQVTITGPTFLMSHLSDREELQRRMDRALLGFEVESMSRVEVAEPALVIAQQARVRPAAASETKPVTQRPAVAPQTSVLVRDDKGRPDHLATGIAAMLGLRGITSASRPSAPRSPAARIPAPKPEEHPIIFELQNQPSREDVLLLAEKFFPGFSVGDEKDQGQQSITYLRKTSEKSTDVVKVSYGLTEGDITVQGKCSAVDKLRENQQKAEELLQYSNKQVHVLVSPGRSLADIDFTIIKRRFLQSVTGHVSIERSEDGKSIAVSGPLKDLWDLREKQKTAAKLLEIEHLEIELGCAPQLEHLDRFKEVCLDGATVASSDAIRQTLSIGEDRDPIALVILPSQNKIHVEGRIDSLLAVGLMEKQTKKTETGIKSRYAPTNKFEAGKKAVQRLSVPRVGSDAVDPDARPRPPESQTRPATGKGSKLRR